VWLEEHDVAHVLAIKRTEPLWVNTDRGPAQAAANKLAPSAPTTANASDATRSPMPKCGCSTQERPTRQGAPPLEIPSSPVGAAWRRTFYDENCHTLTQRSAVNAFIEHHRKSIPPEGSRRRERADQALRKLEAFPGL